MLYKIFISLLVSGILVFALWIVRGVLLTPIVIGRNESIRIILTVRGKSPCLQHTVESLMWLRDNGTLAGEIIVEDKGMDDETRQIAEILQRNGEITLTS